MEKSSSDPTGQEDKKGWTIVNVNKTEHMQTRIWAHAYIDPLHAGVMYTVHTTPNPVSLHHWKTLRARFVQCSVYYSAVFKVITRTAS